MTDKKKGKHQPTIKPGKSKKDELSEKDLEKATGGWSGGGGDRPQE